MPNRLSLETSPYLLQHKNNPVDWFPWGSEALTTAKVLNKPILLSDYLKLGLTLANLTDSEREIVKDLLDKTLPKYK